MSFRSLLLLLFFFIPSISFANECFFFVQFPGEQSQYSKIEKSAQRILKNYLEPVKTVPVEGVEGDACFYNIDYQDYQSGYVVLHGPNIDAAAESNLETVNSQFEQALLRAIFSSVRTKVKRKMCSKDRRYLSSECRVQLARSSTYDEIKADRVIRALQKQIQNKKTKVLQLEVKKEKKGKAIQAERKAFQEKGNKSKSVKSKALVKLENQYKKLNRSLNKTHKEITKLQIKILRRVATKTFTVQSERETKCYNLSESNCQNLSLENTKNDAVTQAKSIFAEFIPSSGAFRDFDPEEVFEPQIAKLDLLKNNFQYDQKSYVHAIEARIVGNLSKSKEEQILAQSPFINENELPETRYAKQEPPAPEPRPQSQPKKNVTSPPAYSAKKSAPKEPEKPFIGYNLNIGIASQAFVLTAKNEESGREVTQSLSGSGLGFEARIFPSQTKSDMDGFSFGVGYFVGDPSSVTYQDSTADTSELSSDEIFVDDDATTDLTGSMSAVTFSVHYQWFWRDWSVSAGLGVFSASASYTAVTSDDETDTSTDSTADTEERTINISGSTLDLNVDYIVNPSFHVGLFFKSAISATATGTEVDKYEEQNYTVTPGWAVLGLQLGWYF